MPSTKLVNHVEVTDRQDCCEKRFQNVEVSVSDYPNIDDDNGKKSCGFKSYNGSTTYKYPKLCKDNCFF